MPRRPSQGSFAYCTHGGARPGAGRPPKGKVAELPHASRPRLTGRAPLHVTVRVIRALAGLRQRGGYADVQWALATQLHRTDFRICHTSIQRDHLHLLVEADDAAALGNGMRGLLISLTRALNKRVGRRGRALVDRYHAAVLATPRQVRNALSYVLNNWRKHGAAAERSNTGRRLDPCSSAMSFAPWASRQVIAAASGGVRFPDVGALPVARPCTWLLREGWRRGGGEPSWHAVPSARPA